MLKRKYFDGWDVDGHRKMIPCPEIVKQLLQESQ